MLSLVTLDPPLASSYFRNNRSTKQKSLRCFPSCCPKGHRNGGFCGRALVARVNLKTTSSIDNYRFIAELRPSGSPNVSQHQSILKEEVLRQLRTKYDKCASIGGQIYEAEAMVIARDGDNVEIELSFNSYKCSWDYMWKSNRWCGPEVTHVINIIVLEDTLGDEFLVKSECVSTPFLVISSHKKSPKSSRWAKASKKAEKEKEADGSVSNPAVATKRKYTKRARPAAVEDESSSILCDEYSQATTSASDDGSVSNPLKKKKYSKRANAITTSASVSEIDEETDVEQASAPPTPLLSQKSKYPFDCRFSNDPSDAESIEASWLFAKLFHPLLDQNQDPMDYLMDIVDYDNMTLKEEASLVYKSDPNISAQFCMNIAEDGNADEEEKEVVKDEWTQMQAFLLPGEGTGAAWMDTLVEMYNTAHDDSNRSIATSVHCESIVNGTTSYVSPGSSSTGFQGEGPSYGYCRLINVRSMSDLSTAPDVSCTRGMCEHHTHLVNPELAAMKGYGRGREGNDDDPFSIKWCLWCEWL